MIIIHFLETSTYKTFTTSAPKINLNQNWKNWKVLTPKLGGNLDECAKGKIWVVWKLENLGKCVKLTATYDFLATSRQSRGKKEMYKNIFTEIRHKPEPEPKNWSNAFLSTWSSKESPLYYDSEALKPNFCCVCDRLMTGERDWGRDNGSKYQPCKHSGVRQIQRGGVDLY